MRYQELKDELSEVKSFFDAKTKEHDERFAQYDKVSNWRDQKELQNRIEISGMKLSPKSANSNVKDSVLELFKTHNIKIEAGDVKFASSKSFPTKKGASELKQVVIVEFNDFDAKLRAMQAKRKLPDGLFFDNSLTAHNRQLMGKVRKIARAKNFAVYLRGSKIYARKDERNIQVIECEEDINVVSQWSTNKQQSAGSSQVA